MGRAPASGSRDNRPGVSRGQRPGTEARVLWPGDVDPGAVVEPLVMLAE